jgi:hypothetical protein
VYSRCLNRTFIRANINMQLRPTLYSGKNNRNNHGTAPGKTIEGKVFIGINEYSVLKIVYLAYGPGLGDLINGNNKPRDIIEQWI